MLENPSFASTDPECVRRLIVENPWATIVSATAAGLVASHYPALLDQSGELVILMHVGRADAEIHEFGTHEVLLIVAGPHGYISPSWYAPGATAVPTWNFVVAHCYGTPEILDEARNHDLLKQLTAHFEQRVDNPIRLGDETLANLAPRTAGIRVPIERFIYKAKMSQDEDTQTQAQVCAALRQPGVYSNPRLANWMQSTVEIPEA